MYLQWLLSVPPALLLVVLALVSRKQQGTWFAPGAFFALVWSLFVWAPLLLVNDVGVWPGAVWWIALSATVLSLGSTVGMATANAWGKADAVKIPVSAIRWPGLEWFVVVSTLLGFVAVFVFISRTKSGLHLFSSLGALCQSGRDFYLSRNRAQLSGLSEPLPARLLLTATYLSALLGGLMLATRSSGTRRWIALLPVLPAVGVAAILTTRSSITFAVILLAASYFAARVAASAGRERLLTPAKLFAFTGTVLAVLTLSVLLQMCRSQYLNPSQSVEVLAGFRFDALGYLAVFSAWFQQGGWHPSRLSFGAFSFAGLFDLLRLKGRVPGLYTESLLLGPHNHPVNIFTVFRGLLEDFGPIGALLLLLGVGFGSGFAFAGARRGNFLYVPILAAFYAATLWSFVVNLFSYNTMLLAWTVFAAILLLVRLVPDARSVPRGAGRSDLAT